MNGLGGLVVVCLDGWMGGREAWEGRGGCWIFNCRCTLFVSGIEYSIRCQPKHTTYETRWVGLEGGAGVIA